MRELVKLKTRHFPLILGIVFGAGGMILGGPGLAIDLYSDVSTETQLAPSLLNKDMRNGSIVDIPDGDTHRDLLVTFNVEAVKAFQGKTSYAGRPTFENSEYTFLWVGSAPSSGSTGLLFADFNNDGLQDFYSPRPGGHQLFQYVNTETETGFKDVTSAMDLQFAGLADFNKTINASWGDYDGDSYVDLLIVQNTVDSDIGSGKLRLLHNDEGDGFSNLGYQVGFSEDQSGIMSIIWADLDQDHDVELILVQALARTDTVSVYYENKFHDATTPLLLSVPAKINGIKKQWNYDTNLAVCSDYNNDGRLDLAYYNRNRYGFGLTNDTGKILDSWNWSYGANSPRVHDLAVFDADHNGHNDLLGGLGYGNSYLPRLWLSDGDSLRYASQQLEFGDSPNDQQGMCAGDFTRDGNTEIFLTRSVNDVDEGAFFFDIYNPEGTTTNWVGFSLEAPNGLCNRMALGATVVVSSSDYNHSFVQAKLVDGGGGRASQADRLMVFGLGDYTGNVDVEITLPNKGIVSGGSTIMYTNLPIGQYHDLQMQLMEAPEISTQISHNAMTGDISLDVIWSTDSPTTWNDDMVRFHSAFDDALVPSHTVYIGGIDPEQTSGPYTHNMVIGGLPCNSSKSFYISVQSNNGTTAMSSSVIEVPINKCLIPGEIPDINRP